MRPAGLRRRLFNAVAAARASYWFLPALMALAALLLGGATVWADATFARGILDGLSWYQKVKADGAHEVLSAIASSMITVAGVTFSTTIVAISFAAGQYGPRLLTNFLADRGNQVTLGTFIATFLYCLIVLRVIRGGDQGAFVPQLAVLVGLVLALCSIAVLIYFIHHIPQSIHISTVVARIGHQLITSISARCPRSENGESRPRQDNGLGMGPPDGGAKLEVPRTGYLQAIDIPALVKAAHRHGLVIRLYVRPGAFLRESAPLAEASPPEHVDSRARADILAAFTVGNSRTPADDPDFLVSELVEIATRALSSGINDPGTATTCLDWLGAGAVEFVTRERPDPVHCDSSGVPRLILRPQDFEEFVDLAFARLVQHAAGEVTACRHMIRVLGTVGAACRDANDKAKIVSVLSDLAAVAATMPSVLAEPLIREASRTGAALAG